MQVLFVPVVESHNKTIKVISSSLTILDLSNGRREAKPSPLTPTGMVRYLHLVREWFLGCSQVVFLG